MSDEKCTERWIVETTKRNRERELKKGTYQKYSSPERERVTASSPSPLTHARTRLKVAPRSQLLFYQLSMLLP